MSAKIVSYSIALFAITSIVVASCKGKKTAPSKDLIAEIDLKRGELISCGPAGNQFGKVEFDITGTEDEKKQFCLGVELLHSFEYDESEKLFAKMIDAQPACAMAYWGVAMSNYHPLWTAPSESELTKGAKAIAIAQSIPGKSKRESEYIDAIAAFYTNWNNLPHQTRSGRFEQGMLKVYTDFPEDKEAAVFYALSLDAAADPADLSFKNQKKAGVILTSLYPGDLNHPGIAHYIIHTYDYPELAPLALDVARRYASIAPSSPHALHMPSHIFTRLGLWDECITSNLASVAAAKCYGEAAGIKGHWDEELHGLDYLVYAYLQKGEDSLALQQYKYLKTFRDVSPVNFKVAYAFAAIPSRYLLENKNWKAASELTTTPDGFPWQKFPWQNAITHFTRLMGCAHLGKLPEARMELVKMETIYDSLVAQKDAYKAKEVQIQIETSQAWIRYAEGGKKAALDLMRSAANLEDKTEKHPVTPCEVIPARELLADMELEMDSADVALTDYKADLAKHHNRYNGLYGAALAAEKTGRKTEAVFYFRQLLKQTDATQCKRASLKKATQIAG